MKDDRALVLLGIPIHNLTMADTVGEILKMIDAYEEDHRPRQIATVNVDFMVNTHNFWFTKSRHPELLKILRHADIITADGMPIVWASRLLGAPLKGRVTGADLVPALAEAASKHKKKIYMLGGKADVAKRAADILTESNKGLSIVGMDDAFVYTIGEKLADADADDQPIVDAINRSGADILLIAFGNPKQEVWFERNRHRLKVPVSIGIGGTFAFIAGEVKRAPVIMQKLGIEWIYRLIQEPKRLWKRYFVGLIKFGSMITQVLLYAYYLKFKVFLCSFQKILDQEIQVSTVGSGETVFSVITLPEKLDGHSMNEAFKAIDLTAKEIKTIAMDFNSVLFIHPFALGMLVTKMIELNRMGKAFYLLSLNKTLRLFLRVNRMGEFFEERLFEGKDHLKNALIKEGLGEHILQKTFDYEIEKNARLTVLRFTGRLDATQMSKHFVNVVMGHVDQRDSILEVSGLDFVDSTGLSLLVKLLKKSSEQKKKLILCGLTQNMKQMLHMTHLTRIFDIEPDITFARKRFEIRL